MTRVLVIGAGSIGNHLAQAARRIGWDVVVTDRDPAALERMRKEIYPTRYGAWDEAIELRSSADGDGQRFDAVFIGTPPDSHIALALAAVRAQPQVVVVEKPLCPPDLAGVAALERSATSAGVQLLVGFDHAVGQATRQVERLVADGAIGRVLTIDVEFREHWEGIFAAHPWLDGPADSYLGYWRRGGGASGEHSHATHLWQHFAHAAGHGRVVEVTASLRYVDDPPLAYDDIMWAMLRTESGLLGTVVQDVVSRPSRKRARLQGEDGSIEWVYGAGPNGDAIHFDRPAGVRETIEVDRRRPDDFYEEMRAVEQVLAGNPVDALSFRRGLDTMLVLAAAHRSQRDQRAIQVAAIETDLLQTDTEETR